MAGEPVPEDLVAGKYKLTRLLGRGGMGSVWEGVHTSLGTRVAVKFIDAEYAESPEARTRFENEARAAAALRSKHVVQVYDHGVSAAGQPYIVMEFLLGEPLDARLDRQGTLALEETARIVAQVARALTRAHEAGIIHRDLKPENVFLVRDDEEGTDIAKVVDFGIAKFTESSPGVSSSTRTGAVLGTPFFMSPEQARGLRSVDHRTDLWSLAVIAYVCVVGQLPFQGEAVGDLLVKICTSPIPVPSQVKAGLPPAFDAWFAKALGREPEERFQTALELADGLLEAAGLPRSGPAPSLAGAPPSRAPAASAPTVPAQTHAPFTQAVLSQPARSRTPLVAGLGLGAILLLGGVAFALRGGSGSAAMSPAPEPSAAPARAPAPRVEPVAPTVTASAPPVIAAAPAPSASAPSEPPAAATRPAATARGGRSGGTAAPATPAPTKPRATGPVDVGY